MSTDDKKHTIDIASLRRMGTVPNPLVLIRREDDAAGARLDSDERAKMLQDLEVLSRDLWHMATQASGEDLSERLAENTDHQDENDRRLVACADLLGLRTKEVDPEDIADIENPLSMPFDLEELI